MEKLPLELFLEIILFLSKKDVLSAALVCKNWHEVLGKQQFVWKQLCYKRWKRPLCCVDNYRGSWKRMCLDDNMKNKAIWSWDYRKCGPGIRITEGGRVVQFEGNNTGSPAQVLGTTTCVIPEKYYFEVEITLTFGRSINVGISGKNPTISKRCGFDDNGWSYSLFSGTIYHENLWKRYSQPGGIGTRIGIGIDMQLKKVHFFLNGEDQGIAVTASDGLPNEVYPSLSIGQVGDVVSIIQNPLIPKF